MINSLSRQLTTGALAIAALPNLSIKQTEQTINQITSTLKIISLGGVLVVGSLLFVPTARAANLVKNGGFELTDNGPDRQVSFNTNLDDWSLPAPNDSYSFVFAPGSADTTGAVGQYGALELWGPGNGSANGLPATSPDGGNYLAMDSAFQINGPLTQVITGLEIGQKYTVSFYDAAAQQFGFDGPTFDQWQVTFGGQTQFGTNYDPLPNHGFAGWNKVNLTFTATAITQTLEFLATGGPEGLPPFALLDGVSVKKEIPEPSALASLGAVMVLGLGAGLISKLRNKQ